MVKLANNHKFISFNLPILKFSCKYSQHLGSSISIKKYFKPILKALDTLFKELPDLKRALYKTVLPSEIMTANDEVSKTNFSPSDGLFYQYSL